MKYLTFILVIFTSLYSVNCVCDNYSPPTLNLTSCSYPTFYYKNNNNVNIVGNLRMCETGYAGGFNYGKIFIEPINSTSFGGIISQNGYWGSSVILRFYWPDNLTPPVDIGPFTSSYAKDFQGFYVSYSPITLSYDATFNHLYIYIYGPISPNSFILDIDYSYAIV